jgi:hypothetical protein
MDVFAFASKNETQGMVLAEAMAAGVPVVALDGPGVREAVLDGRNGYLLPAESVAAFSDALSRVAALSGDGLRAMKEAARETAESFSIRRCAERALILYESLGAVDRRSRQTRGSLWAAARRLSGGEWKLWRNRAHAAGAALSAQGRNQRTGKTLP